VDGHSHHDHKKRDLQVSKKGGLIRAKEEWSKSMRGAKGLNHGNGTVNVFMRVYLSRMCYLRITLICV
jgi:hypothetical protein